MLPFRSLYLLLGLIEVLAALVIFVRRRDLRLPMFLAGLAGGTLEVTSEYWYLKDYWRPITLVPNWPAPEDFVYGFGVTALSIGVLPFVTGASYINVDTEASQRTPWLRGIKVAMGCAGVCLFIIFMHSAQALGMLSIWAAVVTFASIGIGSMVYDARRRLPLGLAVAVIMGGMALCGYAVGLNFLVDGDAFLRHVLLQYGEASDVRIAGNVPLDEVAWNAARAWCVLLTYLELANKRLERQRPVA